MACPTGKINADGGDDASGTLSIETEVAFGGLACADYNTVLREHLALVVVAARSSSRS